MRIQAINNNQQTNFKAKPVGLAREVLQKALVDVYDAQKSKKIRKRRKKRCPI